MKELPPDLFDRCRELLSECDEFSSNESLRGIFVGTEIEEYSGSIHDKNKFDDRINEVIRALKNRRNRGKSVLATFLEILSKRYPDGDDMKTEMIDLAHDISNASVSPTADRISNRQKASEELAGDRLKKVLVIYGHNETARIEIYDFLRGANLVPVGWKQIEESIEINGPSVHEILSVAFNIVQAVIIVFTGDEIVKPKKEFVGNDNVQNAQGPVYQPEPDLLFKAGIAFGVNQNRTIMLALGKVRIFPPLLERHTMRLTNSDEDREELITKLKQAHCIVMGYEWTSRGNFSNPGFS